MARIRYVAPEELAPADKDVIWRDRPIYRALANSLDGARAFNGIARWIRFKSKLDGRLRELVILQIGYVAKSAYEWAHHIEIGREFGVGDADIDALIQESKGGTSALPPFERALLRAAREIELDRRVSDEAFAALRERLDDELIVEFTLFATFYCAVVRTLLTLEIDLEPELLPLLRRFPLE
ncbi:MAG: carboxymuconolactone decarboxylase family protein [Rhodospirillales bacterium]|nr:MAG: carboxymuconolactone decarboxylase family protein [Rhodospirillales bacterium]